MNNMNNDYKDLIQDIILEEAEAEVFNEAWFDRMKAKVSGMSAGAKQGLTNTKNKVVGGWKGLRAGVKNQPIDDEIASAHETDRDAKEVGNERMLESWKKSLTSKIYKFEEKLIKQAQDFVTEIYNDAQKLGISEDDMGTNFKKNKGLEGNLLVAQNSAKALCTNIAKMFNDEYTTHRQEALSKKKGDKI